MIAALVTFENRASLTLEEAAEKFESTAPNYRDRQGLISKSYIYHEDGETLGGFYLWESRSDAESQYTDDWRAAVTAVYGIPPTIQYFDVPVYIDNS